MRFALVVGNAEPAAQIGDADGEALGAELGDQAAEPLEGRFERREAGQLAADVNGYAPNGEAGQGARFAIGGKRVADRDSEFILGGAGGDLGMSPGVHFGVDPKTDRRRAAMGARDRRQQARLLDRFDVELEQAAVERLDHFRLGLADARKDDPLGGDTGRAGAAIFADGDDVRAQPGVSQHLEHGGVWVGLDREGDQRVVWAGDRLAHHCGMAAHGRGRIDIDRRASRRRDGRQRHILTISLALADGEMVHSG